TLQFLCTFPAVKISPWLQFISMNSSSGEGQVIVVSWANYGRRDTTTCPGQYTIMTQHIFADSPLTCVHRCNGKNSCTVEEPSSVDPCVNIYKYLEVFYTCQVHSVTCEGSQAKLQCGEGQVIVVYWANYGRRDNTTCPDGNTAQLQNVTCLSPGSPEYVTNRCNWQNSCTVEAKTSVFGDPCGGTYKYLEVVYDCQSKSLKDKQTTSKNNSTSSLSNIKPV
uniref:SUEL-type lectin domain-containing protein n=1 Tax=Oreochromis niloticus TaxID=8128 RepID=A0A669ENV2_ORENI